MPVRPRLLLTTVAAPALALALSSAAPAQAAPVGYTTTYHAEAQVTLPDGRGADIVIDRYLGGTPSTTFTEVEINVACESIRDCSTGGFSVADLTGNEARFSLGLGRVTLAEIPMTLHGWTGRNASQQVDTPITVSASLTANGPLTAVAGRGTSCTDITATQCRSIDLSATRSQAAVLTVNGVASSGTGSASSGRTLSVVVGR